MVQRPPNLRSMLSQATIADNFISMQSAVLTLGTASVSTAITFTLLPSTQRVTYKFTNTGTKAMWICGSNSANVIPAVVSTATPMPTSTLLSISICNCVPGSAILTEDFPGGTDTISGICKAGENTSLEISIGGGQ